MIPLFLSSPFSHKLVTYKGDYNTFLGTLSERLRNARKAADAQEVKRKHVQAFIDRFRRGER